MSKSYWGGVCCETAKDKAAVLSWLSPVCDEMEGDYPGLDISGKSPLWGKRPLGASGVTGCSGSGTSKKAPLWGTIRATVCLAISLFSSVSFAPRQASASVLLSMSESIFWIVANPEWTRVDISLSGRAVDVTEASAPMKPQIAKFVGDQAVQVETVLSRHNPINHFLVRSFLRPGPTGENPDVVGRNRCDHGLYGVVIGGLIGEIGVANPQHETSSDIRNYCDMFARIFHDEVRKNFLIGSRFSAIEARATDRQEWTLTVDDGAILQDRQNNEKPGKAGNPKREAFNIFEFFVPSPNPTTLQRTAYCATYFIAAILLTALSMTLFGACHSLILNILGICIFTISFLTFTAGASWLFY